jgi:hypothetical protein
MKTSLAPEAAVLLPRVDAAIAELAAAGRLAEAAMVSAALATTRGDLDAAFATLHRLLDGAPPGQAGWLIPIDPSLADLRRSPAFAALAAKLALRAA